METKKRNKRPYAGCFPLPTETIEKFNELLITRSLTSLAIEVGTTYSTLYNGLLGKNLMEHTHKMFDKLIRKYYK